jgi:dienelactone hydrolase
MERPKSAVIASLLLASLTLGGCMGALELAPDDSEQVLARQVLEAPNPLERGDLAVRSLFYGSGTDKNRPEYRDSVAFTTETVDASKLVSLGSSAESRNKYWGFTPDSFPLNARVWYPEGPGPFPLVLVAHGNHNMKDFSDPGYEYLGRHLASRGFILASLDMNFINGGIRGENDARGWLFLKHMEAWKEFNEDPENPLHGLVDMEHIGIMGHSRGGEAVGHAAAFNRLSHYPDDATLEWEFDFPIQAVLAIAPVDGQYRPASRLVPLTDINYLVFHGTHDGDVSSFMGLRTWDRISYTGEGHHFKAAVYVHRANHGQWNTVWGPHDRGPRSGRSLDLRGLLDGEDQRQFALVYATAFLEATLKGREEYLPLFRDHRVAGGWLPKTMYITQFQESSFRPLVTYEEDIDVTTGTAPGVELRGDSLSTWKEDVLPLRYRTQPSSTSTQENQAVWLGWNNRIGGKDTTRTGPPARYAVVIPDTLPEAWGLGPGWTLDLMLTALDRTPGPRKDPAAGEKKEGGDQEAATREEHDRGDAGKGKGFFSRFFSFLIPEKKAEEDSGPEPPLRLSVEVMDSDGHTGKVLLNRYGPVRRPIEIRIQRRDDQTYAGNSEMVLQSYSIPLGDFLGSGGGAVDLSRLKEVRLLFDESLAGTIVLDQVGFSELPPAFLRASASTPGAQR